MTLKMAYSRFSAPSARRVAEASGEIELVNNSYEEVDINWGRASANAVLNADPSGTSNKRLMREAFRDAGVPMPELYPLDGIQFPAIGRPDRHTKGRGLWRVNSEADVAQALQGRVYRNGKRKAAATHFMAYVDAPKEYRVHVFRNRVIRLSEKDFSVPDEGRNYTTRSAVGQDVSHLRNAAKMAVSAVGLDFGAVDILSDGSQAWVLEVNSSPGLGGTMPELYARVFREWKEGSR